MATRKPKRRGNGEGSIFQQASGRWCGQVQLGCDANGKAIRKAYYGKTRQEVAEKVSAASAKVFSGAPGVVAARLTVKELLDEYLWSFKKPSVADVTFEWYRNIANHIYRDFAGVRVSSVTTTQVQRVLNKIYDGGLSRKSVKDIRLLLNQLFKFAVEQDFVTKNPVASTKLPKESRVLTDHDDEVKAISPEDRRTILAATEGNPVMKTALTTLMFTGMRIGEFLALTWKNVDFATGVISVNAALTHSAEYDDRKLTRRSTVVGTTKTSSGVRNIKVSSVVTDALREWRYYLPSHFRCTIEHDPLAPDSVVFPNDRGDMRTYGGFRTTYRRFMSEKQLPPYTIHSYRHTFATMLLEQGVNPRVVQKLLGHADIETTLGTYSHVFAEVFDGAADKLTEVWQGMRG